MKISEKQLRSIIKEIISNNIKNIEESDLLFKKKNDWIEEKKELKKDLTDLLKNIESDDYEEGVEKINDVISSLNDWKNKIQKQLNFDNYTS